MDFAERFIFATPNPFRETQYIGDFAAFNSKIK